ncbi:hypothetical protein SAMN05421595_2279 [Austwickia chelonae]|uniref:Uncharacterized protein n=1 Tax=Austwickia chelonae NBRC 105200 TaxID=1184607 RepID=K6W9W8_9MICO|nr:hypothetical protein [Austwickia chelonae]GAB78627.1 hypothetical protein AUCHE_16_00440 [Austwickia chelonae NBRC 105200]SEW34225.1 hypothetical protein SAMN05421595_2279 [Austwickia chelonae]
MSVPPSPHLPPVRPGQPHWVTRPSPGQASVPVSSSVPVGHGPVAVEGSTELVPAPQQQSSGSQADPSRVSAGQQVEARPRRKRWFDTSSSPAQLRIAGVLATAACILPGLVGMVDIAGAAGAPVSSPTQTYADLRHGIALYEARAAVAAAPGGGSLEPATEAFKDVSEQVGRAALLYPDRASELYAVNKQLVKRHHDVETAWSQRGGQGAGSSLKAPDTPFVEATNALKRVPAARAADGTGHVLIAGSAGLFVLLGVSVWLSRKTRRVVNPGLVGAVLLTGVVMAGGMQSLSGVGTSEAVDRLAEVKEAAASSVRAEASVLLSGGGSSAKQAAGDQITKGQSAVGQVPMEWRNQAGSAWAAFTQDALSADQLSSGTDRHRLVQRRIDAAQAFGGRVATLSWEAGKTNPRPNALFGFGLFGVSLAAGAIAWSGIGRRLGEYR